MQHLGIASIDLGFGGEDNGGEYHSIYDSYDMYTKFKDPKFEYGVVLAKTAGRLTLRLANADIIPFKFHDFYNTLNSYVTALTKSVDEMRSETEQTNTLLQGNYYKLASDPTKTFVQPLPKGTVPYLDFSALQNAMANLKSSVARYDSVSQSASQKSDRVALKLNSMLLQSERKLMAEGGVPSRGWYKHAIYAPGYYTGYGVKTLPGLREAIENRDWKLAQQQAQVIAEVINNYSANIDAAAALLKNKN